MVYCTAILLCCVVTVDKQLFFAFKHFLLVCIFYTIFYCQTCIETYYIHLPLTRIFCKTIILRWLLYDHIIMVCQFLVLLLLSSVARAVSRDESMTDYYYNAQSLYTEKVTKNRTGN